MPVFPQQTAQQKKNIELANKKGASTTGTSYGTKKGLAPGSIGAQAGVASVASMNKAAQAGSVAFTQKELQAQKDLNKGLTPEIDPMAGYNERKQSLLDQSKVLSDKAKAEQEAKKQPAQPQIQNAPENNISLAYEKARQAAGGTLDYNEFLKSEDAKRIMGTEQYSQSVNKNQALKKTNAQRAITPKNLTPPEPPKFTGDETPEQRLQMQLAYQGQVTDYERAQKDMIGKQANVAASDFQSQLEFKNQEIQNLINSLNAKTPGLGDRVNTVLQDMATSGFQGELTPETLTQIEQIASSIPPDQLPQTISNITQPEPAEKGVPVEMPLTKKQEYSSLAQSGMSSAQIVQTNPSLITQVKPDGSILNPNTGVGLIQTSLGEAYKLPSGLLVPRNSSTGFYDLTALSPEDQKKLTYHDVLAMDLSTQQTASDLKAYYSAQTFTKMAQRNDREYQVTSLQIDSFYNSEKNRLDESKLQDLQSIEIERMRQELSKDTSLKQLDESKNKISTIMKAQMDAWGLEGSSAAMAAMSAHTLKFEQEASVLTKTYDINIKELAMASVQTQMQYANRITELNQDAITKKLALKNDYLNRKDEIDQSVLLSQIERTTEQQNMYADYSNKVFAYEEEVKAYAAKAQQEAQAELWEKQKFYADKLGMMVSVGEDGSISPMLDNDGYPIETLESRKFSFQSSLDEAKFNQDVQQFGMQYALDQQRFSFDQSKFGAEFGFEQQQYFDSFNQFDEITWNDDLQTYQGKGPRGLVDLGADFGKMGVAVPTKGIFDFKVTGPGEVRFDVPLGNARSLVGRGQCGKLVNDALFGGGGMGGFGDTIDTDLQRLGNSSIPVAGGAFMMLTGDTAGHKGLIEKVNRKDPNLPATIDNIASIEILHSNYDKKETVQRDIVYPGSRIWNNIIKAGEQNGGKPFFDPIKGGVSQRGGGGGSGEYAKMVKENIASGMDEKTAKEVATTQYKAQQAGLTDAQSSAFNALNFANEAVNRYSSLTKGKDPVKWANDISVINRMSLDPEKPFTAEQINQLKLSPEVQQAINAEASFIQAVLRKESGASISAGEYINYGNQFFPRKGDSAQVLKDKENLRSLKVETLKSQVGPAGLKMFENLKNSSGSSQSSISVDDLKSDQSFLSKYKTLSSAQKLEIEKMIKKGASGNEIMAYAGYDPIGQNIPQNQVNQSMAQTSSGYNILSGNQSQFSYLFD